MSLALVDLCFGTHHLLMSLNLMEDLKVIHYSHYSKMMVDQEQKMVVDQSQKINQILWNQIFKLNHPKPANQTLQNMSHKVKFANRFWDVIWKAFLYKFLVFLLKLLKFLDLKLLFHTWWIKEENPETLTSLYGMKLKLEPEVAIDWRVNRWNH